MKLIKITYFIIGLIISLVSSAYAQAPRSIKIQDKNLISILCSIDTVIVKSNDDLAITLFKVHNAFGSARIPGTDEVTNRYFISVSTIDDSPEVNLYEVGNFYNPKLLKYELIKDKCHIVIEYGVFKQRKTIDLILTVKNIIMKNI